MKRCEYFPNALYVSSCRERDREKTKFFLFFFCLLTGITCCCSFFPVGCLPTCQPATYVSQLPSWTRPCCSCAQHTPCHRQEGDSVISLRFKCTGLHIQNKSPLFSFFHLVPFMLHFQTIPTAMLDTYTSASSTRVRL